MARPNLCYSDLLLGNESGFTMTMKYLQFWHSLDVVVVLYSVNITHLFDCRLPLNHKKGRFEVTVIL